MRTCGSLGINRDRSYRRRLFNQLNTRPATRFSRYCVGVFRLLVLHNCLAEMRCELTTGRNDSRYGQFDKYPETIGHEFRPAVCKQRQTVLMIIIDLTKYIFNITSHIHNITSHILPNHCSHRVSGNQPCHACNNRSSHNGVWQ